MNPKRWAVSFLVLWSGLQSLKNRKQHGYIFFEICLCMSFGDNKIAYS